jgi:hypothetical protein
MHRQISVVDCSCYSSVIVLVKSRPMLSRESYIVASLWLPETDIFGCQTNNVALVVHNARSSTACSYIDANVVVNMRSDLIARVSRHLSRLLPRILSERH